MTKPKLILLTDLWGLENSEWLQKYMVVLEDRFKVNVYDSRHLAEIATNGLTVAEIHGEFLNGGIEKAVSKLIDLERKPVFVLAFSIGGTIAWKAALKGLPILKLWAISSTRLRKEYQKPPCEMELYFGEMDMNRPMDEWFETMEVYPSILRGKDHELYKEEGFIDCFLEEMMPN